MRVFNDMTEIVLDAPNAYHTLSKFVELCFSAGFVSKSMVDELPQRLAPYITSIIMICTKMPSFSVHCVETISLSLFSGCRGRKRFVSEGDGGAIKVPED